MDTLCTAHFMWQLKCLNSNIICTYISIVSSPHQALTQLRAGLGQIKVSTLLKIFHFPSTIKFDWIDLVDELQPGVIRPIWLQVNLV